MAGLFQNPRCCFPNCEVISVPPPLLEAEATSVPSPAPPRNWTPSLPCASLARLLNPVVVGAQRVAFGRVLDLRGPLASGFSYAADVELLVGRPRNSAVEGCFDTICSFGSLSAAANLPALLAEVRAVMGKRGRLLFVELDGGANRWCKLLDRPVEVLWGISPSRDISGILWATGFELLYMQRKTVRFFGPLTVKVVYGVARLGPGRGSALG